MNYKGLKKIIKELSSPLTPGISPNEASKLRLQTVKAAFFSQVDRELEKVNSFYLQKEADTKSRLRYLIDKKMLLRSRGPRNRATTIHALREAFLNSRHGLDKLQNFVEVNNTGFRKILKKWDKRSKSSTKELYLAHQVDVQPCFNQDIIADFSDTVTQCLSELEHALEEENELMESTAMPNQLDLLSSPSMRSALQTPQDATSNTNAATAASLMQVDATKAPVSELEKPYPLSAASQPSISQTNTINLPTNKSSSSLGFLADTSHTGSIQLVDRAEAELFQALQPNHYQTAIDILNSYKQQKTSLQRTCVTRVLWRSCSELQQGKDGKQRLLLESGLADLNSTDDINKRTLAHEAAIHGSLTLLQAAVDAGCGADGADYYGRRPIHYAAINGHSTCLQFLIARGCSVGAIDEDGSHAFEYAIVNGHSECARLLLEHERSIVDDNPDHPALVLACEREQEDIVLALLEVGAKIAPDWQGLYPTHVAARVGNVKILGLLLEHGAAVNVTEKDLGWTPMFYAASEGNIECVRILVKAGCDLDVVDENGSTAMYFAASQGHLDCLEILLENTDGSTGLANPQEQKAPLPLPDTTNDQEQLQKDDYLASGTGDNVELDADADADAIPSLSLPPPLIPFRVYGHNFLGKHTRVQIRMHSQPQTGGPPIRFADHRDISALKLMVVAKPDAGMVPHTVILPLEAASTTFGFPTDDPENFRLEFVLYPSFGLQPIGKAVALPSLLFSSASSGKVSLPLLDRYLKLVAEVSFDYLTIRPFQGAADVQTGNKVNTYWKSTSPGLSRQNMADNLVDNNTSGGQSPSMYAIGSGSSMTPLAGRAIIGSPVSATGGGNQESYSDIPMVVSSSLAAEHICVQVQVCQNGVPVVTPQVYIEVNGGIQLPVCDLTHVEFQKQHQQMSSPNAKPQPDLLKGTATEWHGYVQDGGFTLYEVLTMLPVRFGISIQVLSILQDGSNHNSWKCQSSDDVNGYVDAILKTVYNDSQKTSGLQDRERAEYATTASTSGPDRINNGQRNTIFCSYDSHICVALNWKQPNYAVFLLTSGRGGAASDSIFPASHLPLKDAIRFANHNSLLGIMCESSLLLQVPALIKNVKNSGLFLISFGQDNDNEQSRTLQRSHGVDALMKDGVIQYEADDSTAG